MSDTLTLKFPAMERYVQSSHLEVSFTPISTNELSVSISATVGTFRNSAAPLEFSARTLCYGYDLAEFARELEQLHPRYDGGAKFLNHVESFELFGGVLAEFLNVHMSELRKSGKYTIAGQPQVDDFSALLRSE